MGFLAYLVILAWAVADILLSERAQSTKIVLVLALIVTLGIVGIVYGLFFASSTKVKYCTLGTVGLLLLLAIVSISSCGTAISLQQAEEKNKQQALRSAAKNTFNEKIGTDCEIDPFLALLFQEDFPFQATALLQFAKSGPVPSAARSVAGRIKHVAYNPATTHHYALTDHDFGILLGYALQFEGIKPPDPLAEQFSWPKGIAVIPEESQIIIMTSHVDITFYNFDISSGDWSLLSRSSAGFERLTALAYLPEQQSLFAVQEPDGPAITTVRRFNLKGVPLGTVDLYPPIPIAEKGLINLQLHASRGNLVLILPPRSKKGAQLPLEAPASFLKHTLFVVNPDSGSVSICQ